MGLADWFSPLTRLQPESQDGEATAPGVWTALKQRLDPVERRPLANPHVVSRELSDRNGAYTILKNVEVKTYLRISKAQFHLWQQMDGQHSVQDLIVEHFMATGSFAHAMILRLVDDLSASQMLAEPAIRVWGSVREKIEKRSLLYRLSAPARFFLTQKLAINNLDGAITALYRSIGWLFFTRPAQLIYLLVSAAGLFAFGRVLQDPNYVFIGDNYITGIALIWVASLLPVFIHELGHALTVKHYGREVPRGGLMLYFAMPAAFVETTDIWLEPRRARVATTWNGPYTGLILGGALALVMLFFPAFSWNSFLFKMAGYAYLTVIFNINPLLKYDGYYILTDSLEIPSLRERSLAFIRKEFIRRLLERKKFSRDEKILTVYGGLSLVWTAYALYLISFLWQTRVQAGLQVLFGSGYSLLERFLSFILAAGVLSFAFLIGVGLLRLARALIERFARSGGLARHSRLAYLLAAAAVLLGLGASRLLGEWAPLSGLAVALGGGFLLWRFAKPYQGSPRGAALRLASAGIATAGMAVAAPLLAETAFLAGPLVLGSGALVLLSGGLLGRLSLGHLKPVDLALGAAIGAAAFYLLSLPAGLALPAAALGGLIALAGALNALSLRGGARAPAVILVTAGAVLFLAAREGSLSFIGLDLAGLALLAAGALHWSYARLPDLSQDASNVDSARTQEAVRLAVAALVRRVIAQVYFESGRTGVHQFGQAFSAAMHRHGLKLRIEGNQFFDEEFAGHTVIELTELYGVAFDELHTRLSRLLGSRMGSLVFNYGVDRLPWQNREVVLELILSRCSWSSAISDDHETGKKNLIGFLKRVPLFVTLDFEELERVAANLKSEQFAAGNVLIRQGDRGDKFYIIERGQVSFWQTDENGQEKWLDEKGAGQFFGDIALVSNKPRNATVRAETPLSTFTLNKADFDAHVRQLLDYGNREAHMARHSWLLRSMPIFDELESHELDWLAANLQHDQIPQGKVLFREGDPGDRFYIVEDGELIVSARQKDREVEISRVKSGEYVGEIALLQQKPRTATITAAKDSTVLSLAGEDFLDLVSGYSTLGSSISNTSSRRLSYLGNQ